MKPASSPEVETGLPDVEATSSPALTSERLLPVQAVETPFCQQWIAGLCESLPQARSGLVLIFSGTQRAEMAYWSAPQASADKDGLRNAALSAMAEGQDKTVWAKVQVNAAGLEIMAASPLKSNGIIIGAAVIGLSPQAQRDTPQIFRRIHWAAGWIEARLAAAGAADHAAKAIRLLNVLDAGLTIGQSSGRFPRLQATLIAMANDQAQRLGCARVTIGLMKGGRLHLSAISHSAVFKRETGLGDAIENAMDEALDQGGSVVLPPVQDTARRLTLAHSALARLGGSPHVMTVPLMNGEKPLGAITWERGDTPFDAPTLAVCETYCALASPVIALARKQERWLTGRLPDLIGQGVTAMFGPRRPALKLGALALAALAGVLFFVPGDHRVSAKAVMEGAIQRAAAAPFEGYISAAPVKAGDIVREGDLLASLDDKDLQLEQAKWRSELEKSRQKYQEALSKRDKPSVTGLNAEIRQARAQLDLVEEKLARTRIKAPFDGIVVSGDLSQSLGSPVEKGKTLFEIAPLDRYRVILHIDERDLPFLKVGQSGRLVLTGMPGQGIDFTLSKITPVATAEDGRNLFKVEADVARSSIPFRPGMEGVAKVNVGRASLAWIYTHPLWDWISLTAWTWIP